VSVDRSFSLGHIMSTKSVSADQLPPGTRIGGCKIIRLLMRGGMGEIYLAKHQTLQKKVAVKLLPSEGINEKRVRQFFREARVCAKIEHPNVVPIYNVGEDLGRYFIVMQYVRGQDLAQLVNSNNGPLPWEPALQIIRSACKGVAAVHENGIIHRDIKPSNIMVTKDYRVLLMDFGLVKGASRHKHAAKSKAAGTPAYMSPEQCLQKKLDPRSDVFALGGTLYSLLTARLPYGGTEPQLIVKIGGGEKPTPISQVNPEVPPEVCDFVGKAMAFDRKERFADGKELGAEAGRLLRRLKRRSKSVKSTVEVVDEAADWHTVPEAAPIRSMMENITYEETGVSGFSGSTDTHGFGQPQTFVDASATGDGTQSYSRWLLAAGIGVLVLALVMVLFMVSGRDKSADATQNKTKAVYTEIEEQGVVAAVELFAKGKTLTIDVARMVKIPTGFVLTGENPQQLRKHLSNVLSVPRDDKEIDQLLSEWNTQQRRTEVASYWVDKYEVTNAEYAKFLRETGHRPPRDWSGEEPPTGKEDHPVVHITHESAEAYANWAGKQLPTAEQWLRAFRGSRKTLYPWGDQFDHSRACVYENANATEPVTASPHDVSPREVFNLVGNARELMRDVWLNDHGREMIECRGADWNSEGALQGIGTHRALFPGREVDQHEIGFRCVVEVPEEAG